jgi:hypothetical protein
MVRNGGGGLRMGLSFVGCFFCLIMLTKKVFKCLNIKMSLEFQIL